MNLTQYLLIKLAEEANEVSKEAMKGAQLGLTSLHKSQFNACHIRDELLDLVAVATMLEQHAKTSDMLRGEALWPFSPLDNSTGYRLSDRWYKICFHALGPIQQGFVVVTPEEDKWIRQFAKLYEPGIQA